MTFVELRLELIPSVSLSFLFCFSAHLPTYNVKVCIMGFCKRCGEIVSGPKCKCGGTAVGEQITPGDGSSNELIRCFHWFSTSREME